jgi:SpoVK/Ycf46/Vps4 family AAA+-type ATPase
MESNKKELKNIKKNDINNKSLNPEDFIKVIPLNNKLTKISEPNNKISDIFEMLIKKTIKKDDEFIPKKELIIDLDLKYFELSSKINGLESLISFAKNINTELKYSFNAIKLKSLVKPLEKLNDFIGMENIKNNISKQIIYYLQDLDNDANIMHTIITGPPGLGKTKLAHLLSEIYFKMNVFMKKNEEHNYKCPISNKDIDYKLTIARRSDLVGEYIGHTAIKTQTLINKSLGGVLFIDEAYALGNDKKDSFSKECIDTINQNLTENKDKFLLIIAGYEDDLESNFFAFNKGLRRRFAFKYSSI